jgi:hypothetical protein
MREVEDPAAAGRVRSILGSDTFVEWLRREFLLGRVKGDDDQLRRRQSGFEFDAVLRAVAAATAQPPLPRPARPGPAGGVGAAVLPGRAVAQCPGAGVAVAGVTQDITCAARPQDRGYDLGAYQFASAGRNVKKDRR